MAESLEKRIADLERLYSAGSGNPAEGPQGRQGVAVRSPFCTHHLPLVTRLAAVGGSRTSGRGKTWIGSLRRLRRLWDVGPHATD